MNKLLAANFSRLKKDKIFWLGVLFMLAAGLAVPLVRYGNCIRFPDSEVPKSLEHEFFLYSNLVGVVLSIFSSMFIGAEYSNGTIRNKVVVGHARGAIYLSNLVVAATAGFAMCMSYMASYLCVGIPLFGFFEADLAKIVLFMLGTFFMVLALSAVFTLVSMLNANKALVTVICILTAFVFLFSGMHFDAVLSTPETYPEYDVVNGEAVVVGEFPNPNAVKGTERDVYEFLYDFTPGGQAVQYAEMKADQPQTLILYSAVIIAVATGAGLFFFRKKNLR